MNGTDGSPSPPVDALDGVIDGLNHVIPVFDERQPQRGVNTRYIWAFSSFLSSHAQNISLTTQNTRRKQIIPTTPKLSILKETAVKAAREIDSLHQQEWASENANANERRFLVGISQGHIRGLLNAITSLESHWGSFHVWLKQPKRALCESLIQAWKKGELDSDEFLGWFREHQLLLQGPELDPYIAQVLLRLHVFGGEIRLPGDLQNLAHLDDHETYAAIVRMARARKEADQDWRRDRIRLTVGTGANGRGVRRFAQSVDAEDGQGIALKDKLPDISYDPIEFLCSSRQPVKLVDLAEMRAQPTGDERWASLNLTLDEYRFVRLHYGYEMTQDAVGQYLDWDAKKLAAVRRNADLKVQKHRQERHAERPKSLRNFNLPLFPKRQFSALVSEGPF